MTSSPPVTSEPSALSRSVAWTRIVFGETDVLQLSGTSALLAPMAQVSLYPWKEPKDRIPLAVRHIRTFLRAHRPAAAGC